MAEVLLELSAADAEHPDVSLTHESGGSISVFRSGLAVFENVETGEGPWHIRHASNTTTLELWQLLAAGRISELQGQPWVSGYGSTSAGT